MKKWLFYISCLFLFGCINVQTTWSLIKPNEIPGVVSVVKVKNTDYRALCSGVLIKPNAVLTAEHCVDDIDNIKNIGVILNCSNIYTNECVKIRVFSFARYKAADLAILLINRIPSDYNHAINIVEISTKQPIEKQFLLVAGYGTHGILKAGVAQIWAKGGWSFMTDYRNKSRPEHGDSGGPAFIIEGNKLLLSGITSEWVSLYDSTNNEYFTGMTYRDVSYHIDWINQTYEKLNTQFVPSSSK